MEVTPFQMSRGDSTGLRVYLLRSGRLVFCERLERIVGVGGARLHSSPTATCADARTCQESLISGHDIFSLEEPCFQFSGHDGR